MSTGRAILFHGPGRPLEAIEAEATAPQGRETLSQVTCCTLCASDLHTFTGRRTGPTPTVLGHEIVGRVAAFGPEAPRTDMRGTPLSVGDRVTWSVAASCGLCFFGSAGLRQKCERLIKYGHQQVTRERPFAGGLADYVLLEPGASIVRLPDDLADAIAATASCAGATAAAVVRAGGPAVVGGTVLIFGAGPFGLWACAMSRAAGAADVIVFDPDAFRLERASEYGATVVHSLESAVWAAVEATAGRGADVVLELSGAAPAVRAALTAARVGGTVVLAGTVLPTPPVPLDPEAVVRRLLTIRGVHNYVPTDLSAAVDFLAGPGRTLPFGGLVGRSFPLVDAAAAFAHAKVRRELRVAVVP
jgi:alcohol dehydrogenase